jgi:hypothetical protein
LGAVLTQKENFGLKYSVSYASQGNNTAYYSSYEGEALAAIWAIAHFQPYLYGQRFILVTDHQPLRLLMELDKLTCKLAMWALLLHEYDFEVVHRGEIINLDANGLSRNPSPLDEDLIGARWHCDREAVPSWHTTAYLTLFSSAVVKVSKQGLDDETNQPQAIARIYMGGSSRIA